MVDLAFPLKASRAHSAARCIVPLITLLYACGDRDITVPDPFEDPGEVVETPSSDRAFELLPTNALDWPRVERSPVGDMNTGASVTPAALDGALSPVTPTPTPTPDMSGSTDEPEPAPLDCSAITPAPASYELLEGFTSSEDFVFDALGNYVGVDDDNNLVRVSRNRERTLWAPKIGSTAGMGVLRDGSVVFCEVEEGALKRVYPNGAVTVVLGGLLYPNGLDIGPDGFVYVAENNAGRVRRVNPDTGEFTIVAMGLQGANGVAFSSDPHLLYVGSFEGSGVYKVEIADPDELGQATVFARTPGSRLRPPESSCPDQIEGLDCVNPSFTLSRCQALANVVDCLPVDPCPDLEDGEYCDHPALGVCRDHRCDPLPTCEELGEGAACEDPYSGPGGVCQSYDTFMFCGPPNPCADLRQGAACEDPSFGSGICQGDEGYSYCSLPNPCEGQEDGVSCNDPYSGPGVCRAVDEEYTYCEAQNPCEGLSEGDACEDFSFGPGVCQSFEEYTYCAAPEPCDGLTIGEACEDSFSGPGICQSASGYTYCASPAACEPLSEGAPCDDPYVGSGFCQTVDGQKYCLAYNPCEGLRAGDGCEDISYGPGSCYATERGPLVCAPPNVCLELSEGDLCEEPPLGAGTCHDGVCVSDIPAGGGIDGLGVDACGNVYASEYVYGNLWRISPAGEMELLAQLPSSWIPNIKWGRGLGGFSSDVMYVADRHAKRLFGIYVGVPGVTEFAGARQ